MNNTALRVFIVEDEAIVAMELEDRLREMGYAVCGHATRGEQAQGAIRAAAPDVVLLDVRLPGEMSGIELAERLQTDSAIPIIFLTAYSDEQLVSRAIGSGSFSFVTKPFQPQVLRANIEMAMRRYRLERELSEAYRRLDQYAKEKERVAEERLRLALNAVGMAVWEWDFENRTTTYLNGAPNLFGQEWDSRVLSEQEALETVLEPDRRVVLDALAHTLQTGEDFHCEFRGRLPHSDGTARWFASRGTVETEQPGRAPRMLGVTWDISRRKQAEEALRKSEAEARTLALIASRTHNGVILCDALGRVEWVNDGFTRMTGYQLDEVRGRTPGSLLQGAESDRRVIEEMRQALRGERGFTAEIINYHKSGRAYWVSIEVRPIRDETGRLTHFMAIESDITERVLAERELRRLNEDLERRVEDRTIEVQHSLSLLGAAMNATADGLLVVDLQGRVTIVNRNFQEMWQISDADLRGGEFESLVTRVFEHLRDPEAFRCRVRELFAHPEQESFDVLEFNDGRVVERISRPQILNGRIVGRVCSFRDVTERIRSERKLRESEDRFRLVWGNAVDGMRLTDGDGTVVAVNEAYCRLVGKSREELEGQPMSVVYATEDRSHILQQHQKRFTRREVPANLEKRMSLWDGRTVWLEASNCFIETDPARPLLLMLFRDVSQRKQVEEQMTMLRNELTHVARLRTMGELASGIAHELNQPLTAIANYAFTAERLVAQSAGESHALVPLLNSITGQSLRAGDIVRSLRKMIRGSLPSRTAVDIRKLIDEVLALSIHDIRAAQIKLKFDVSAELPSVLVDSVQIQQVLLNLFRNAIDALNGMPGERILEISAIVHQPDSLLVCVKDSGPGIAAEVQTNLFSPFFTTKSDGLGLGLVICKRIIEAHSWQLWCESAAGSGAAFYFTLLLATPIHD